MCTVSWLRDGDGYELLCNRDEQIARAEAVPPRISRCDGVAVLAPRDGQSGGSWISVNDRGIAVCLLNGANITGEEREPRQRVSSRGLVVTAVASSADVTEVRARLGMMRLGMFAPFTLVALAPGCAASILEWNGHRLSWTGDGEQAVPLASSSVDAAGARLRRRREFDRLTGCGQHVDRAALLSFHTSHLDQPGPHSPCMHRSDAATVSFSRISVLNSSIDFEYAAGAPCEKRPTRSVRLGRRR